MKILDEQVDKQCTSFFQHQQKTEAKKYNRKFDDVDEN